MVTREQVEEALEKIMVPGVKRSVIQMNLLRDVEINGSRMKLSLSKAAIAEDVQNWIRGTVQIELQGLDGISEVAVNFEESTPKDINKIDKVVAVMSGKGGVGKSLVTGLIALAMSRQDKKVGILDADITGPSIPMMFGIKDRPWGSETGLLPLVSRTGIEIMSMNFLLPNEDDAVIWRGPLIAKTITQFWEDVLWGKLDYLMLDLPPGTADVPLTIMQSIPLSGVILVFTPQDLTAMVVRKAVKMAQQMNVPILGVVENMSYFLIPETGKNIHLFGQSKAAEMARIAGGPMLGQIPIDPEIAKLCDEGNIENYDSEFFKNFQEKVTGILSPGN
ncbi:MAG: Mrp/NBP35 family ATP-binding protein [Dehalococcoidia bacterium]|nr:Mrp/NBP35 family ATP-binding protein [Dehalococcoidia bacterium]